VEEEEKKEEEEEETPAAAAAAAEEEEKKKRLQSTTQEQETRLQTHQLSGTALICLQRVLLRRRSAWVRQQTLQIASAPLPGPPPSLPPPAPPLPPNPPLRRGGAAVGSGGEVVLQFCMVVVQELRAWGWEGEDGGREVILLNRHCCWRM
jgi:hypothetical protein